ncbi:MAG TPA: MerR family transcriptional regulator, partial [Ilumatobacteraceae bacterium]|nr:MerR family transcriptional regulator [Ilumatobacteraceae bacterium]
MTTGLRIKEVADASGFSASTLRYYEQIGLLPEASRTPAGYRMFDERTLDRLAFIARAKRLGCSLEEITGLITAWDGGQCGPVQDQLRHLVA